jgi:hypothetical protein
MMPSDDAFEQGFVPLLSPRERLSIGSSSR